MATLHRLSLFAKELTMMMRFSHQGNALNSSLAPLNSSPVVITALQGWASSLSWDKIVSWVPSLSDMTLLAAPKRKVTPSRKGNRSAMKQIRFVPIVSKCSKCDRVFEPHAMPSRCEHDECPAFNLRARPKSTLTDQQEDE